MYMCVKKALPWVLLLCVMLSVSSPLLMTRLDAITVPIAHYTICQAIFFAIAERRLWYFLIAGLMIALLLLGAVAVQRGRWGLSLCGAAVPVLDILCAGSRLAGDLSNSYLNTMAVQACVLDAFVILLYIPYFVGQHNRKQRCHS